MREVISMFLIKLVLVIGVSLSVVLAMAVVACLEILLSPVVSLPLYLLIGFAWGHYLLEVILA